MEADPKRRRRNGTLDVYQFYISVLNPSPSQDMLWTYSVFLPAGIKCAQIKRYATELGLECENRKDRGGDLPNLRRDPRTVATVLTNS